NIVRGYHRVAGAVGWHLTIHSSRSRFAARLNSGVRWLGMKYADGTDIEPGDVVQIDWIYRGRVIASMDTGKYLPGEEQWAYLAQGIMVDTDFGGLVHYTPEATDDLVLIDRPTSLSGSAG
ncbi:hypothetical protein ACFQZQ_14715, partial [Lysobacter koreensis]